MFLQRKEDTLKNNKTCFGEGGPIIRGFLLLADISGT
jgi:hypothetical protein